MFLLNLISQNPIVHFIVIVIATIVIDFLIIRAIKNLGKIADKTKSKLDDVIIDALTSPVRFLIWGISIYFIYNVIATDFGWQEQNIQSHYLILLFSFVLVFFIFRLSRLLRGYLFEKMPEKKETIDLALKVVKIFITFVIIVGCIQSLGYEVSAILTFGGLSGMVIAFSAKDVLANIFSGIMLQIDKPFYIGDWIRISEKNIEGTVEKIGWRITVIRTFSKNPIYVPNALLSTVSIETPSRMINRRIYETIGVRYDDVDKLESILVDIRKYLAEDKDIDKKQIIMAYFNKYNEYSVDFFIYAFTVTKDWNEFHEVKEQVLFNIGKIITKHKAEIAFPTEVKLEKALPKEK